MGLADQQFFLSLELTKFAVKVTVSLRRDQSVATTLYQGKVRRFKSSPLETNRGAPLEGFQGRTPGEFPGAHP